MKKWELIQNLFACSGYFSWRRFMNQATRVDVVQRNLLCQLMQANAQTDYGKRYGFSRIKDFESYQNQVPLLEDWQELEPYIQAMEMGKEGVLHTGKLLAFEETSGTSGPSKLIPYTKALRNQFQQAIGIWMFDLWKRHRRAFAGKSFWSVSPALRKSRTNEAGIQIGLTEDSDYFNPVIARLIRATQALSQPISNELHATAYYREVLVQLLACKELSFISCWSPSYFLMVDDHLRNHWNELLEGQTKSRYGELAQLNPMQFTWKQVWPGLELLSCWTSAQSALFVSVVQGKLGDVRIQGKGLLATEFVCSIPMASHAHPLLTYTSMVYEFRREQDGKIYLAHELKVGDMYELIISNAAGLYRYATKDLVLCKGHYKQIPALEFLGRKGEQSDLVGEKLTGFQVSQALQQVYSNLLQQVNFIALKAWSEEGKNGYHLLLETPEALFSSFQERLTCFEDELKRNPYYAQALQLEQLQPIRLKLLPLGTAKRLKAWQDMHQPIPDGQQKPRILYRLNQLPQPFETWLNT
ncbi:MAG: GH3 auxin-responsive promoter family protein [Bacteroidetes bacterium]|nr:GH3 auxin-responsive promoter family protein [Bacteroidota bacterium]